MIRVILHSLVFISLTFVTESTVWDFEPRKMSTTWSYGRLGTTQNDDPKLYDGKPHAVRRTWPILAFRSSVERHRWFKGRCPDTWHPPSAFDRYRVCDPYATTRPPRIIQKTHCRILDIFLIRTEQRVPSSTTKMKQTSRPGAERRSFLCTSVYYLSLWFKRICQKRGCTWASQHPTNWIGNSSHPRLHQRSRPRPRLRGHLLYLFFAIIPPHIWHMRIVANVEFSLCTYLSTITWYGRFQ